MSGEADVDLLIVGAGFAGLTAARAAALRGLSVRVVDAKPEIGSRLHTTGIFVKEALGVCDLPARLLHRISGVRLYGPSRRHVDLAAPGYYFATTDTGGVLRWLAEEARRAGADLRTGARFRGGGVEGDTVVARVGGERMSARWLIGADGARSRVAPEFELGVNTRFLVGLEREYAAPDDFDANVLHCVLDSRAAPGYLAWACRSPDAVQVGLAASKERKPHLAPFASECEDRFGLDHDQVIERRSGVIPCGGLVKPWARDRVTLVGDAAGMVSPMTAGGIKLALDLGRKTGQAVADHLLAGAPAPEVQLKAQRPNFFVKQLLRDTLDLAPANALLDLAIDTPLFRAFAQRVFLHSSRRAAPLAPGPSGG